MEINKRHSTKFDGVFWRASTTNNKEDRTYYISFKDRDGKKKELKIGKHSAGIRENYCKIKRDEILHKIRNNEDLPISHKQKEEKPKFTFSDAFSHYLEAAKERKKGWKNDEIYFRLHIKEQLGDLDLAEIKSKTIEEFRAKIFSKGYKTRTVNDICATIRATYNYCIKHELTTCSNPISGGKVSLKEADNARIGYLSREQAEELLKELAEHKNKRLYQLTILLLYTGARFIEVASLTWNDINFNEGLIYFARTKGGNARYIAMHERVYRVLQELKAEEARSLVIPNTTGGKYVQMQDQWQHIVDRVITNNKTAETKHRITVHSLRHTHASWLALAGVDIMNIKEQLGHRQLTMTLRYAHLVPSKRHEATKLL